MVVLVRDCAPRWASSGIEIVRGDVEALSTWEGVLDRIDAVCHLAARVPLDMTDASEAGPCMRTNALATLEIVRRLRPGVRFVWTSSGNVAPPGVTEPTEDTPPYPVGRAPWYLASKAVGEMWVEHSRLVGSLDAITLRVASIYGRGLPARSAPARFVAAARDGHPLCVFDEGRTTLDLVYVDDVASALVDAVVGHGAAGIYNVASGKATSVLDLARTVSDVFAGGRATIEVAPAAAGSAQNGFAALPTARATAAFPSFRPRSLREGLVAWKQEIS